MMLDLARLLAWLLVAAVLVSRLVVRVRDARVRRCQRQGHDWTEDARGYACRRCKGRRNVGDFM